MSEVGSGRTGPEPRASPLASVWVYSERWGVSSSPAVCACGPDEVSSLISPSSNSISVYPPHKSLSCFVCIRTSAAFRFLIQWFYLLHLPTHSFVAELVNFSCWFLRVLMYCEIYM